MNEPKRVLIVDDDPDFVSAIEALFQASGCEVRSASNGEEGIQAAKTFRPDLILLDVMMRERTEGFFALQEIRRSTLLRQTPVIVVSSIYADLPAFRVSPEAGWLPANLFLPKPVDPTRLLDEARRLMEAAPCASGPSSTRRSEP
jgi:CheY-like chemotaxis protein